MSESIMQTEKRCYLTGAEVWLDKHHVFTGPRRKAADKWGCWVWLRADYHNMTKIDGYGYFTFALRYAMLDDCLKLSLVINDPFHQHVTDETIYNSKILASNMIPYLNPSNTAVIMNQWRHTNHHSHYIGLTATYSFGGKKVRYVRHDLRDTESKRAEKQ